MNFNFDDYLIGDESVAENANSQALQSNQNQTEDQEQFNFNKYLDQGEKGYLDEGIRHLSRAGSRIGETIIGFPGDVFNMVKWISSKLPQLPKSLEKDPNFIQKKGREILENLPTSSELKEKMSELTEGFTDPQTATEEFGDSIIELAAALTFGKDPTKIKTLLSSLGKATAAKGAKKTAELFGAGEKGQMAAELGTLFLTGLIGEPLANAFASEKYKEARSLIPQGAAIDSKNLSKDLSSLEKELSKGISTASKNEVKSAVSELMVKADRGQLSVEELVDSFHDINERMTSKKLFDELSRPERKKLKFRYDMLKDKVGSEIGKYGKKNPEFYKKWKDANQAYATLENSKKVTSFLESHVGKLPAKVASGMAIELFLGHPEIAAATAGTFASLKTGEMLYRISKSPTLRKHYLNVIKSASEENLPAVIKSMGDLEKGLQKSFSVEQQP